MKIYTSYFYQIRFFPKTLVGLSTAVWNPRYRPMGQDERGVICLDVPPLKPGKSCENLCRGNCAPKHPQTCDFLREYRKQLDKIIFPEFLQHLEKLAATIKKGENLDYVDFALIVYEAPTNPCSERVVLQQWLHDNGLECKEWKN